MAYDTILADRIRAYLAQIPKIEIIEKEMFGGLSFLINEKMCINVSGENLMCRFDPSATEEITKRNGFLPMIMNGKKYKGYCYVEPFGCRSKQDLEFWIGLCLDYNKKAKPSKKRKR